MATAVERYQLFPPHHTGFVAKICGKFAAVSIERIMLSEVILLTRLNNFCFHETNKIKAEISIPGTQLKESRAK